MKKFNVIIIVFFLITSCNENAGDGSLMGENRQNVKVLKQSLLRIEKRADTVHVGEKTRINITSKTGQYGIVQAYINCHKDSMKYVDTNEKRICGCKDKLYVEKDTVKIGLTLEKEGHFDFHNISLLIVDSLGMYYVVDTTFSLEGVNK